MTARNPFFCDGPTQINFSGGRTSAYLLRRVLDAHGGTPPPDVHVLFANTGREREETLDFVEECSQRWAVPVVWLEYCQTDGPVVSPDNPTHIGCHGYRVVSHAAASRNAEPFDDLIRVKRLFRAAQGKPPVLPNVVQRWCSGELKQRTMRRHMETLGYEGWDCLIGFRADEMPRVAGLKGIREDSKIVFTAPLARAGVTEADVLSFWRSQPFDLRIQSYEGNCDLCFLKKRGTIERLLTERPDLGEWWIEQEAQTGQRFRKDRPGYAALAEGVRCSLPLTGTDSDDGSLATCFCTD